MLIQGSVSQTSDFCLFQHQITSNFYPTVSSKLNASNNKPNKTRLPSLNPKESEISLLDGEVVYNLRKMLVSTQRRELLWVETITKHTLGWEIDERNLKIMNLTYFRPKMRRMSKTKKKQPSQRQICRQNIRRQKFRIYSSITRKILYQKHQRKVRCAL